MSKITVPLLAASLVAGAMAITPTQAAETPPQQGVAPTPTTSPTPSASPNTTVAPPAHPAPPAASKPSLADYCREHTC